LRTSTNTRTCRVPASSNLVDENVVVDSESSGGRIAVMIPRYKDSSRRLAVSRSSIRRLDRKTRKAKENTEWKRYDVQSMVESNESIEE